MKSIGFGLDRIALAALDWPRAAAALFLALLLVAAFGVTRLSFDEDLRDTFASNSPVFEAYRDVTDHFVDPENETLVLVEGEHLGDPATFQKLQDFQFELQLLDGVDNVFSIFALRHRPEADGNAPLLIDDPGAGLTPELSAAIRAHPLLGSKLLSADGKAMLFDVTPAVAKAPLSVPRALKAEIEKTASTVLSGTDAKVTVSGFPIVRVAIIDILQRDQIVLNVAGAVVGFLMSLLVFRSIIAAIIVAVPAILGALTVLGVMGLTGTPVTVMSTVIPALVMIFGYTDGMHLCFAWRRYRDAGLSVADGGAAGTAGGRRRRHAGCDHDGDRVSLARHLVGHHRARLRLDRRFGNGRRRTGRAGRPRHHHQRHRAPVEDRRDEDQYVPAQTGSAVRGRRPLRRRASQSRSAWPRSCCWSSSARCTTRCRRSTPSANTFRRTTPPTPRSAGWTRPSAASSRSRSSCPCGARRPNSPAALQRIGAIHEAVAAVDGVSAPLSIWSVVQWLGGGADQATATKLAQFEETVSPKTARRFYGTDGSALITANIQELPSYQTAELVQRLEAAVKAAGGDDVVVTGVTVINSREGARTISNLNLSLSLSVIANLAVIAFAFRSIPIGLISFLPNFLPLLATGAFLFLTGRGMQFTSVIALTVVFGIAVDGTVHFLNRYLLAEDPHAPLNDRLVATTAHVGPVLVGTTLIIIAGLSTTLTSGMPTIATFGWIASLTLVVALVGDLVVLPGLLAGLARPWFEKHQSEIAAARAKENAA